MQEREGPRTRFRFCCSLEHFAASGFDMVHHRTPLLRAARLGPGRKAKDKASTAAAHGRDHLTLRWHFPHSSISLCSSPALFFLDSQAAAGEVCRQVPSGQKLRKMHIFACSLCIKPWGVALVSVCVHINIPYLL